MMSMDDIRETLRKTSDMDLSKMSAADLIYYLTCVEEFATKVKPLTYRYYVEGTHNNLLDALRKAYEEEHK